MSKLWIAALSLVPFFFASCAQPPSPMPSSPSYALRALATPAYSVIYGFHGRSDGANPSGVAIDNNGTIYGTTFRGGGSPRQDCGARGCGVAYLLSPNGSKYSQKVLHRFQGADGANPVSELAMVGDYLYGTTFTGGAQNLGTVFQLQRSSSSYSFSKIFDFTGTPEVGELPSSGVVPIGRSLYGAAEVKDCSCSLIYSLQNVSGTFRETLVTTLQGPVGYYTFPTPVAVGQSLFATNENGGHQSKTCPYGCGTAFELTGGAASLLHTFLGTRYDGATPYSRLWQDTVGDLFGTTLLGGGNTPTCKTGCGVVFELSPSGSSYTESIVYRFTGTSDGRGPRAIVGDSYGRLFGTTETTIFELKKGKNGYKETTLHTFGSSTPNGPEGQIAIFGGSLFGALSNGGFTRCTGGCGAIYRMMLPSI